jgi:hypothetical protein
MIRLFVLASAALLIVLRLPSLVQPMGADQALYAYVGDRIAAGGLPYRDAWDQKPPAIHFLYAGLRALWHGDAIVPAADLAAAAAIAWFLYLLGSRIGTRGTGAASALLFLLYSNPAFTRVGGVRLRAQCETFIAVAIAAALLLLAQSARRPRSAARRAAWPVVAAGLLFGVAFAFKYNAATFAVAGVASLWLWKRPALIDVVQLALGLSVVPVLMLLVFALGGALRPLLDATLLYNLQYSGETYAGATDAIRYLLAFPIERARVDALWTLGGAGCLLLLAGAVRDRTRLVPILWVAAACASIAINGSRSLPQYFVQANPALALAAGWGGALAWEWLKASLGRSARIPALAAAVLAAYATVRVNQFDKLADQTLFDARHAAGSIDRAAYLARYDDDRKYSAAAGSALGEYLRAHSAPADRVYVFGFTCSAYVASDRASASRFFWSRPVIVGFNAGRPGYGVDGLLSELHHNRPAVVALQQRDWAPDGPDSAAFFMATPALAGWLQAYYVPASGPEGFDVWVRRSGTP